MKGLWLTYLLREQQNYFKVLEYLSSTSCNPHTKLYIPTGAIHKGCPHIVSDFWLPIPCPVDTGRKLNVHQTFRRRLGRLLNVLCTFNLRPVSAECPNLADFPCPSGHKLRIWYGLLHHHSHYTNTKKAGHMVK